MNFLAHKRSAFCRRKICKNDIKTRRDSLAINREKDTYVGLAWRRGRPLTEILDLSDTLDAPIAVFERDHADFYRVRYILCSDLYRAVTFFMKNILRYEYDANIFVMTALREQI